MTTGGEFQIPMEPHRPERPRTVVHFTDSAAFGGAERALSILLSGFDRRRWRPVLLYHPEPGLGPLLDRAEELGVVLRPVPRVRARNAAVRLLPLVAALRRERPAAFHAHLTWPPACRYGLLAAAVAGVPAIIATMQLFMPVTARRAMLAQRVIGTLVDRYVAVSRDVARRLEVELAIPARKITVVHNAVPTASVEPARSDLLRDAWTGGTDRPVVLTVARLDEQKGHQYLIDAALSVPDAVFILAGDGPLRAPLEAQVRTLGLGDRIIFLGYRDDIPELLAASDLFVLPSLFEGLPLSILEAMAAGKPVIATAVGGTDEAVVDGVTGLLVPTGDSTALAAAIRRLLSDAALARDLKHAAGARVRHEFGADTMVERVCAVYEEVLAADGQ